MIQSNHFKNLPIPFEESSFILSRMFSGIMNGGFYGNLQWLGVLGGIATIFFTILSIRRRKKEYRKYRRFKKSKWNNIERVLFWASFVLTLLSIVFVLVSFASPMLFFADIHLWTFLTQGFQMIAMFLNNPRKWWRLLLLVTPAVFLQKLFINILGGNPWYYQGTNIASGSHYTMMGIKIPRLFNGNMYVRLVFTLVSILVLWLSNNEKKNVSRKFR